MTKPIFMDHQSTTPVDAKVLATMTPFFREDFGNAASKSHGYGTRAEKAVEEARTKITHSVGATSPEEIIFTSGATESDNLAIRGVAEMYRDRGKHIITTAIEHHAVLDTCKFLETQGFKVTYLPVNQEGFISIDQLKKAITKQTILISVIHAHNEIGVIQPIDQIGAIARKHNIFFHTDAAQSVGKIPFNVGRMQVDLASFSAHKMYGPKGIGALYVRKKNPRVRLQPQTFGGGHEQNLRPGTLNTPGIVGFGAAVKLSARGMTEEAKRLTELRERLRKGIMDSLDHVHVNGSLKERLPGNLNLSFAFVEGGTLLKELSEEIAVSSGSACTSASLEPSYVLKALGVSEALEHTSIRFGLGRANTTEEVDFVIRKVVDRVKHLRSQSPLYEQ
jgi:cysteine desulfurase